METCTKCSLIEGNVHNSLDYGNPNSKFLIVRNYPPLSETKGDDFLSSKQNKFLVTYLKSYGFTEDDYYITSIIRCYPNHSITSKEVDICAPTFYSIVNKMKPNLILGFGKLPTSMFMREYEAVPMHSIAGKEMDYGKLTYIQNYSVGAIINDDLARRVSNMVMDTVLDVYRFRININK